MNNAIPGRESRGPFIRFFQSKERMVRRYRGKDRVGWIHGSPEISLPWPDLMDRCPML